MQQTGPGTGESDERQPGCALYFKTAANFRLALGELRKAVLRGLDVWKLKGAAGYVLYHDGIYHTGHNEGQLTAEDIEAIAKSAGATDQPQGAYHSILAQAPELTGTPALLVMPAKGAMPRTITVFPGLASAEQIQTAVKKPGTERLYRWPELHQ